MLGYKLILRKALKDTEAKAATETGDLQKVVVALNTPLAPEKGPTARAALILKALSTSLLKRLKVRLVKKLSKNCERNT